MAYTWGISKNNYTKPTTLIQRNRSRDAAPAAAAIMEHLVSTVYTPKAGEKDIGSGIHRYEGAAA